MTLQNPAAIEFLLWCHTRPEPYPNRSDDLIQQLLNAEVIKSDDGKGIYCVTGIYRTTDKGRAWVEILCNTPAPTVAFIDDQGRVVKV